MMREVKKKKKERKRERKRKKWRRVERYTRKKKDVHISRWIKSEFQYYHSLIKTWKAALESI